MSWLRNIVVRWEGGVGLVLLMAALAKKQKKLEKEKVK